MKIIRFQAKIDNSISNIAFVSDKIISIFIQNHIIFSSSGIDMGELRENINKVLTEISEIDSSSGAERDIEDVIQNAKIRRLNDLTDKLWEILKRM